MRREVTIMHHDLVRDKWSVEHDLTDREFRAIGYAAVQWAYLEHLVYYRTLQDAHIAGVPAPTHAASDSFRRRIDAWRILIEETGKEPSKSRSLKLISRICNAEAKRHKIIHGLWDWDPRDLKRLTVSSFRPPHVFDNWADVERLERVGREFGEINFQLEYPNGPEFAQGAWLRRSELLRLGTNSPETPDHRLTKPPRRKRPQSPQKG